MSQQQAIAHLSALIRQPVSRCLRRAAGDTACHLVGGYLRDRLLEVPCRDLDAVVGGGSGDSVARRLEEMLPARRVDLGRGEFAAYRLVASEIIVDLWDRQSMSVVDDLTRRDFTVNSIAVDLSDGGVEDPCDGVGDLHRRILRAPTSTSFSEDPLRVLRLPRLAAQLPGFSVDPATLESARSACRRLSGIATERIREELRLLFEQPGFRRGLELLTRVGALPQLWSVPAPDPAALDSAMARIEELSGGLWTLPAFSALAGAREPDLAAARWATLFGLSAPASESPASAIRRFQARGYLSRAQRDRILRFSGVSMAPSDQLARRRFLHHFGPDWPTALVVAEALQGSAGWSRSATALAELAATHGRELFDPPRLIDGRDISRVLGLAPGPAIGALLSEVEGLQVDGSLDSRSQALAWLAARPAPTDDS